MSTSTVVAMGLLRLVLLASQVKRVRRKVRSTLWNVISFLTVPLLKIWYVSSIKRPDFVQVTRGKGFPAKNRILIRVTSWNNIKHSSLSQASKWWQLRAIGPKKGTKIDEISILPCNLALHLTSFLKIQRKVLSETRSQICTSGGQLQEM